MNPVYRPPVISHLPNYATNQHVINAAIQTTDVQIGDAEESSCKDTKKILVLSL